MSTDYIDQQLERGFRLIPSHMHGGVKRYVLNGVPPGNFLRLLLENDFMAAAGHADEENQRALWNWAVFLYNHVPGICRGSPERVVEWMGHGGAEGLPQ